MTTDTPRTDAFCSRFDADPDAAYVEVLDHARTLERDLSECRAALAEQTQAKDAAIRLWNDAGAELLAAQTALAEYVRHIDAEPDASSPRWDAWLARKFLLRDTARALATNEPQ